MAMAGNAVQLFPAYAAYTFAESQTSTRPFGSSVQYTYTYIVLFYIYRLSIRSFCVKRQLS